MVGSVLCAHSTISLISFAWDMTAEFGIRETAGYLVATGVEGGLSLLVVPLLLLVGASIAVGPWIEVRSRDTRAVPICHNSEHR